MYKHRKNAVYNNKYMPIHQMMNELGTGSFYIELIEEYPCANVEQLRAREGATYANEERTTHV